MSHAKAEAESAVYRLRNAGSYPELGRARRGPSLEIWWKWPSHILILDFWYPSK